MSGSPTPQDTGQFGLWGKESKRDWPLITQDEARCVLDAFGLTGIETIEWHSARPFSAVSRLRDQSGAVWFLKRHHCALRDTDALAEEHGLIEHLARNGLKVALPRRSVTGETAFGATHGQAPPTPWRYECFPALAGQDLYRERMSWEPYVSTAQAYAAGRALACFHAASSGWSGAPRSSRPLVSALTPLLEPDGAARGLARWINNIPGLSRAMDSLGKREAVFATLAPHFEHASPFLQTPRLHWGHGDWHGSNLIWQSSRPAQPAPEAMTVSAPFDFSMADLTTRGFDIAVALERSMVGWLAPQGSGDDAPDYAVEWAQVAAFLSGYDCHAALSAADRAEIAAFLPLAHVVFACSEIWYYACLLNAPDLAAITCESYLLAHARWFGTPKGSALLDFIVTCSDASP